MHEDPVSPHLDKYYVVHDDGFHSGVKTTSKRRFQENIDQSNFNDTDEEFQGQSPRRSRRQEIIERSVQDAHELMEQKFDKLDIINRPPKNQLTNTRSGRGA